MHRALLRFRALAFFSIATLAACSGTSSGYAPQSSMVAHSQPSAKSAVDSRAATSGCGCRKLYVAVGLDIDVLQAGTTTPTIIRIIPHAASTGHFINDIAVDSHGALYVLTENYVKVYQQGASEPSAYLSLGNYSNYGNGHIAIGPDGTVYVSASRSRGQGAHVILVFAPGATAPSRKITLPYAPFDPTVTNGLAVDASSNLWTIESGNASGGYSLVEYPDGSSTPTANPWNGGTAAPMLIDGAQNLLFVTANGPRFQLNWLNLASQQLVRHLNLPQGFFPESMALDQGDGYLYTIDQRSNGNVLHITMVQTGQQLVTVKTLTNPGVVAVGPAPQN